MQDTVWEVWFPNKDVHIFVGTGVANARHCYPCCKQGRAGVSPVIIYVLPSVLFLETVFAV